MNLCFYFFKENLRFYDKADVLAFFEAIPEITITNVNEEYHLIYDNKVLNYKAKFIIGNKSVVPNIQTLNPAFYDINIRLELSLMLPIYKANLLFKICGELCQRFNFFIYNELYEDVSPFRINMLVQAYTKIKQAYKMKYEEEFMQYYKCNANILETVYDYTINKDVIVSKIQDENLVGLDYVFLGEKGNRNIKLGVRYDGFSPFVLPAYLDYIIYLDKEVRFIKADEFINKCSKLLKVADTNVFGVTYTVQKDIKKLQKILEKSKFTLVTTPFVEVDEQKILDI